MIRLQNNTPQTYYERSRDFQFIGRLYDVVLNSVKTNADIVTYGIPYSDFSPDKFLELLSRTLGFKPKHNYTHEQLLAICNVFSAVLRNKGNIQAIQLIGEAILKTEGILGTIFCLMKYDAVAMRDLPVLRIIIPEKLAEIALFYDLLEYVVPAGVSAEVVRGTMSDPILAGTLLGTEDNVILVKTAEAANSTYRLAGNVISQLAYFKTTRNSTSNTMQLAKPISSVSPIITDPYKIAESELAVQTSGAEGYNYIADQNIKKTQDNHIATSVVWRRGSNYKKGK